MISKLITGRIPIPYRNKPKSDPQRSRLYILEREFMGVSVYLVTKQEDLQAVANHACRYYGLPAIPVTIFNDPELHTLAEHEYEEYLDGETKNHKVRLNKGYHGANVMTLLHELAHYITGHYFEQFSSHGPQFVAIYMHLLHKYRIIPSDAFRVIAKRRRVKIAARFRPDAIK